MSFLNSLGILIFFVGILALPAALLILLGAAINRNKKMAKSGLYILVGASVTLLISFSLCSFGPKTF